MKKTVSGAKRVIILRGLQGSGKSTYAKQLVDTSMYKRINYDSLRWYDSEGNSKMEFRCFVNEIDKQAADLEFEARVRAIKCKPEGK
jgi:predicted kinase